MTDYSPFVSNAIGDGRWCAEHRNAHLRGGVCCQARTIRDAIWRALLVAPLEEHEIIALPALEAYSSWQIRRHLDHLLSTGAVTETWRDDRYQVTPDAGRTPTSTPR